MNRPFIPARLQRKRRQALATLWFEQLWPAVWPSLGVLGGYACLSLLDVPALLPPWPRFALLGAVLLAALVLLWIGLRRMARPGPAAADRRLERASGLTHRPLATIGDRPAAATPEQESVWREHVARLTRQIRDLRVGVPRPGLATRDPRAIRAGVLVMLVACIVIAGPDAWPRLERGFLPQPPALPPGPGIQIQAWVTPPAYTGLPPLVLHPETQNAKVPVGSHLTISLTGDTAVPSLAVGDQSEPFKALDTTSWQAERVLDKQGNVVVRQHGATVATWSLALIADDPPVPSFTEPPGANVIDGRPTLQSRFAWKATDDYGVASLQIELRLRDRPDAPPLVINGALTGNPKNVHGITITDLTAHPWAGLPVTARLVAKDEPGQVGLSDSRSFTLPERNFTHPVARALIAVRRQLSLTPDDRKGARAVVDGLADQPDAFDNSVGILLNLRALSGLLEHGREPTSVDDAQARMWQLALALEENAPERTARALAEARQNLRDALDPNHQPTADQAEIDRRMQELRDAIQRRLQALADQARRDGSETPFDPTLPQMNAQQLDQMAQQLQQDLRDGKTQDAQRDMAQLEQLLDQLQNARPESGQQRERRRAEGRQRGRQQTDAIQDMVQREGSLLDHSERRASDANHFGQPQSSQSQQGSAQQGSAQQGQSQQGQSQQGQAQQSQTPGDQRDREARAQRAMRRALGELMQRYGDLTGQVPQPLGEADQAMREGAQALADGRDAAAGDAAKRAIEALQKGGQQMGQQLARQFGTGQQQGQGQDGDGDSGENVFGGTDNRPGVTAGPQPGDRGNGREGRNTSRDPLGRPLQDGTNGSEEAGDVRVPDQMEQARTRAIQDELRRREADRTRRQLELDYIDRLLRAF